MKKLIKYILIITMVCLTACSDKKNDPTPSKQADIELIKKGVLGTWKFVSAQITKDGITMTYSGGCDFAGKPLWYKVNAIDTDYSFVTATSATTHRNCSNETFTDWNYVIKEVNGKFTIEVSDDARFEIITPANEISGKTLRVNLTTLIQGATNNILTFSR
jgi:hypothetical protein